MFNAKISPASEQPSHAAKKQLLVDVDDLTVVLGGQPVIENASFCVHSGEFIGVLGPNGAGKTTLLKALLGLIKPAEGKILVETRKIGYIPQRGFMRGGQVPLSVLETVRLGSRGDVAAAKEALQEVGMLEHAAESLKNLSGGQQQRVLIAKALASNPGLLILDEPTTGIDQASEAEFYRILGRLKSRGIAIVMVSHDVETIVAQADRVICLNHRILYDGAAEHFEIDQYLPKFYTTRHRLLHHKHGDQHA